MNSWTWAETQVEASSHRSSVQIIRLFFGLLSARPTLNRHGICDILVQTIALGRLKATTYEFPFDRPLSTSDSSLPYAHAILPRNRTAECYRSKTQEDTKKIDRYLNIWQKCLMPRMRKPSASLQARSWIVPQEERSRRCHNGLGRSVITLSGILCLHNSSTTRAVVTSC